MILLLLLAALQLPIGAELIEISGGEQEIVAYGSSVTALFEGGSYRVFEERVPCGDHQGTAVILTKGEMRFAGWEPKCGSGGISASFRFASASCGKIEALYRGRSPAMIASAPPLSVRCANGTITVSPLPGSPHVAIADTTWISITIRSANGEAIVLYGMGGAIPQVTRTPIFKKEGRVEEQEWSLGSIDRIDPVPIVLLLIVAISIFAELRRRNMVLN